MMTRGFRLLYLLGTAAFVISIYGGTQAVSDNPGTLKTSTTLRHVGSILFAVLYILLVVVHIMCWMVVSRLARYRRLVRDLYLLSLPYSNRSHRCSPAFRWPYRSSASEWRTPSFPRFLVLPSLAHQARRARCLGSTRPPGRGGSTLSWRF